MMATNGAVREMHIAQMKAAWWMASFSFALLKLNSIIFFWVLVLVFHSDLPVFIVQIRSPDRPSKGKWSYYIPLCQYENAELPSVVLLACIWHSLSPLLSNKWLKIKTLFGYDWCLLSVFVVHLTFCPQGNTACPTSCTLSQCLFFSEFLVIHWMSVLLWHSCGKNRVWLGLCNHQFWQPHMHSATLKYSKVVCWLHQGGGEDYGTGPWEVSKKHALPAYACVSYECPLIKTQDIEQGTV